MFMITKQHNQFVQKLLSFAFLLVLRACKSHQCNAKLDMFFVKTSFHFNDIIMYICKDTNNKNMFFVKGFYHMILLDNIIRFCC